MNGRFIEMSGSTFEQWTVLRYAGRSKWLCRCNCGKTALVVGATLRNGTSTKCRSCARTESNRVAKLGNKNTATHGKSKTRLYRIWSGIISRCENPHDTGYENYGGRGICICPKWRHDFLAFERWAIANGYDARLSIDRIDVDGNYEPNNCRWATEREQSNNKTSSRFLEFNGYGCRKTIAQWAECTGISRKTIEQRINKYNWPVEKALSTPVNRR